MNLVMLNHLVDSSSKANTKLHKITEHANVLDLHSLTREDYENKYGRDIYEEEH